MIKGEIKINTFREGSSLLSSYKKTHAKKKNERENLNASICKDGSKLSREGIQKKAKQDLSFIEGNPYKICANHKKENPVLQFPRKFSILAGIITKPPDLAYRRKYILQENIDILKEPVKENAKLNY